MEDAFADGFVGVKGEGGTAGGDEEDGGGVDCGFAREVRRAEYFHGGGAFGDGGEGVEEVPEGGAVGDGVVDGAADENGVGELGDLDGREGVVVASVGDHHVVGEEFLEARVNINERGGNDGVKS